MHCALLSSFLLQLVGVHADAPVGDGQGDFLQFYCSAAAKVLKILELRAV